jgi:hypothetical protein
MGYLCGSDNADLILCGSIQLVLNRKFMRQHIRSMRPYLKLTYGRLDANSRPDPLSNQPCELPNSYQSLMDQVHVLGAYAVLHAVELVALTRANRVWQNNVISIDHMELDRKVRQ